MDNQAEITRESVRDLALKLVEIAKYIDNSSFSSDRNSHVISTVISKLIDTAPLWLSIDTNCEWESDQVDESVLKEAIKLFIGLIRPFNINADGLSHVNVIFTVYDAMASLSRDDRLKRIVADLFLRDLTLLQKKLDSHGASQCLYINSSQYKIYRHALDRFGLAPSGLIRNDDISDGLTHYTEDSMPLFLKSLSHYIEPPQQSNNASFSSPVSFVIKSKASNDSIIAFVSEHTKDWDLESQKHFFNVYHKKLSSHLIDMRADKEAFQFQATPEGFHKFISQQIEKFILIFKSLPAVLDGNKLSMDINVSDSNAVLDTEDVEMAATLIFSRYLQDCIKNDDWDKETAYKMASNLIDTLQNAGIDMDSFSTVCRKDVSYLEMFHYVIQDPEIKSRIERDRFNDRHPSFTDESESENDPVSNFHI